MNWKNLISDLLAAKWTQAAIGQELGRSQSWVADIVRERYRDIPWSEGQRLLALHKRVVCPADPIDQDCALADQGSHDPIAKGAAV